MSIFTTESTFKMCIFGPPHAKKTGVLYRRKNWAQSIYNNRVRTTFIESDKASPPVIHTLSIERHSQKQCLNPKKSLNCRCSERSYTCTLDLSDQDRLLLLHDDDDDGGSNCCSITAHAASNDTTWFTDWQIESLL
jgi:hypothetical protein